MTEQDDTASQIDILVELVHLATGLIDPHFWTDWAVRQNRPAAEDWFTKYDAWRKEYVND